MPSLLTSQCDEQRKPKCGNCTRLNQECSFLHVSSSPASSVVSQDPLSAGPKPPQDAARIPHSSSSTTPVSPHPSGPAASALSLVDLRLLHNFVVDTSQTMNQRPAAQEAWAVPCIQLACEEEYVMRAVFAVSAAHLAAKFPSDASYWLALSQQHLDAGLVLSRPALASLNQANASHCFAFSALVAVYHWAWPLYRNAENFRPINGIVQAINLIRGSAFLTLGTWAWVAEGPLATLIDQGEATHDSLPKHVDQHLCWLTTQAKLPSNTEAEQEACEDAIKSLRRTMDYTFASRRLIDHVMRWPAEISPLYLSMLEERKPSAIIVLAYFAPLMSPENWLFDAWQESLLRDVDQQLRGTVWEQPIADAAIRLRNEFPRSLNAAPVPPSGPLAEGLRPGLSIA